MGRSNPSYETRFSGANGDREIYIFPVQLTTSRIGNLAGLICTLLYVRTIHTYIQYQDFNGVFSFWCSVRTYVVVVFFALTYRASTIPGNIYAVANPVHGLLDRKRSEEHLPSSNESKRRTQTNKNDKEKGTRITKYTCQKKIDEGHSIERVWHSASREPSDTLPGSQPCTQTRSIYHIPNSQGFSFH